MNISDLEPMRVVPDYNLISEMVRIVNYRTLGHLERLGSIATDDAPEPMMAYMEQFVKERLALIPPFIRREVLPTLYYGLENLAEVPLPRIAVSEVKCYTRDSLPEHPNERIFQFIQSHVTGLHRIALMRLIQISAEGEDSESYLEYLKTCHSVNLGYMIFLLRPDDNQGLYVFYDAIEHVLSRMGLPHFELLVKHCIGEISVDLSLLNERMKFHNAIIGD